MRHFFTSESVTEGHPDKVADQISDSILDAILTNDRNARVAIETLATTGLVVISGEVHTTDYVDMQSIARATIRDIGYTKLGMGFDAESVAVLLAIDEQSPDISAGVDKAADQLGAGDQGIMFGYACNETPELMPLPIMTAHALARRLTAVRRDGTLKYLRPDGKTQVTFAYKNEQIIGLSAVVVSTMHSADVTQEQLQSDIRKHIIEPICGKWLTPETVLHINPAGQFVVGGPAADTGLTGRKIIVDTYGGSARHGGGAFSGKDPSKVDRSGAYAARWIAKSLVAAGLAKRTEIQLSYAIGVSEPLSIRVDSFGTGTKTDFELSQIVQKNFNLTPSGIISELDLLRPIYTPTAAYGHFGKNYANATWEVPKPLRD